MMHYWFTKLAEALEKRAKELADKVETNMAEVAKAPASQQVQTGFDQLGPAVTADVFLELAGVLREVVKD